MLSRLLQHSLTTSRAPAQVVRQSRLFETAPEGVTDQPAFLNAALAVRMRHTPLQLLECLKGIEVSPGRGWRS